MRPTPFMLNFISAKLLVDFWACISPASNTSGSLHVGDLVKLKIEGVSAHEIGWPPPVVFHDYLWLRVTEVNGDVCNGTIVSRLVHVNAWMAADAFKQETEGVFGSWQVHDIKQR